MSNEKSYSEWLAWQKEVIRSEEYKDIIPARKAAQTSFDKVAKSSLNKVKEYVY